MKKMLKTNQPNKKHNNDKMKNHETQSEYTGNAWKDLEWVKNNSYKTSKEKLGTIGRKYEDWFNEHSVEVQGAILDRSTRQTKGRYRECNRALQQRRRELKNKW